MLLGPALALSLLLGDAPAAPAPPPPAPPPALPWAPGERHDLEIDYLGITMGRSSITVGPAEEGRVPVTLATRSAGIAAVVTLRQSLVSWLDEGTLLPTASVLDATEPGGYHHTDTARFDREAGTATVREVGRFDSTYLVEVPPGTLDFVALVFRLRTLPLEDGRQHEFQVLAARKVSRTVVEVVKHEVLEVPAGRFYVVKVRVPTGFDGKFSEKRPTYVWLSDDRRRLVVRISTEFAIGRAEASLVKYAPGAPPAAAP